MNTQDPHSLTASEALELIESHLEKRKKRVHSFVGGNGFLAGCDIDLTTIKKRLKESEDIRLAGPNMSAMGHGLCYYSKTEGYVFLKTDMEKIKLVHTLRGI